MNREPTDREREVAAAIKKAWKEKKKQRKELTQEKLAELLDMSQGGVSHYINGHRPFQLQAYLAFCKVLEIDPMQIYPEIVSKHGADKITEAMEFSELYLAASKDVQQSILTLLKNSSVPK